MCDHPIDVLNAGVAGYGPVEAANLLGYLLERGFHFDVVVFSLFIENDFTDNLPGTVRRAVVGIPLRVPESRFLRFFHPLHITLVQWLTFIAKTRLAGQALWAQADRITAPCEEFPPSGEPPEALISLVKRRTKANYSRLGSWTAEPVVRDAVERMVELSHEVGAVFILVVFPDRFLADDELRTKVSIQIDGDLDLERLVEYAKEQLPRDELFDLTESLRSASGVYRFEDTHLSDRGNRIAGVAVGRGLLASSKVRRALSCLDS
jgi:hypothetical protein